MQLAQAISKAIGTKTTKLNWGFAKRGLKAVVFTTWNILCQGRKQITPHTLRIGSATAGN